MHEEEREPQRRNQGLDVDLGRSEPFQAFAPVQQHLQPDQTRCKSHETEEIEGRILRGLLLGQGQPHRQRNEAGHRQPDIEDRPPAVILAEPAADAGAGGDAQDQAHRPHQADAGMPAGRQQIEQNGQRQRSERAARSPLDDAGQDELLRGRRQGVEHQAGSEAGERPLIDQLAAEPASQPARHRHDDETRRDVGREDPADLVERHRQRALHMLRRRIGQRDVERLHVGRRQGRGGDGAMAGGGGHFSASSRNGCAHVRR